jgi:hypothetical protein
MQPTTRREQALGSREPLWEDTGRNWDVQAHLDQEKEGEVLK